MGRATEVFPRRSRRTSHSNERSAIKPFWRPAIHITGANKTGSYVVQPVIVIGRRRQPEMGAEEASRGRARNAPAFRSNFSDCWPDRWPDVALIRSWNSSPNHVERVRQSVATAESSLQRGDDYACDSAAADLLFPAAARAGERRACYVVTATVSREESAGGPSHCSDRRQSQGADTHDRARSRVDAF